MPRAALLLLSLCCSCITLCYATGARAAAHQLLSYGLLTSLLLRAALAVGALMLAHFVYQQLRMYVLSRHIPGPSPTWPLLGNILQLCIPQEDLLESIMAMRERFGPTWRVWIGPHLTVVCCDPEDLRVVFSHPQLQNKATVYKSVSSILGDGLITLDLPAYHRHRKALNPAMHQDTLKNFIPKFEMHGSHAADALEAHAESGATFDARALTDQFVCESMCDTLLSSEIDFFRMDFDEMGAALQPGSELIVYLGLRPWFYKSSLCLRLLAPERYRQWKYYVEGLQRIVEKVLARKEEQLQNHSEQRSPTKELLEHILTSKEGALIDRHELLTELKHMIIASTATTSEVMSLLMLSLALEPDVQAKVHQELDEVFADDPSRPVIAEDLHELRYLEMTIKEVLRFFPVVPIYGRTAQEDVKLPSGTLLPKGSLVLVLQKTVHWDPRWFPEPSKFDPERFLPEAVNARPNFSFLAFSAGTRSCIGQRFALMFIKTIAATFLRKYRFLPDPNGLKNLNDAKLVMGIALHLKGGINVRVERRE